MRLKTCPASSYTIRWDSRGCLKLTATISASNGNFLSDDVPVWRTNYVKRDVDAKMLSMHAQKKSRLELFWPLKHHQNQPPWPYRSQWFWRALAIFNERWQYWYDAAWWQGQALTATCCLRASRVANALSDFWIYVLWPYKAAELEGEEERFQCPFVAAALDCQLAGKPGKSDGSRRCHKASWNETFLLVRFHL